jgi:hypothetical protein
MVASLIRSTTAITTLVNLLAADNDIAANYQSLNNPEDLTGEPRPFSNNTRFGLLQALLICSDEAEGVAEMMGWPR